MNIKVQCCGLVLMLIIFYFYGTQRKIRLNTEKAFFRMICTIIVSLSLDILSLAALTHQETIPERTVNLICKSYIATLVLVALCGVLYVCTDIYKGDPHRKKISLCFCMTAAVGIILIYALPIYKFCDGVNMYTYGPSALATYAFAFLFFFSIVVLMHLYKDKMNPRRREAVQIWAAFWIIAAILQFLFKELLIVGYSGALAVMIIYLKLENPETNLDRQTGLYNQNSLLQYMDQLYEKNIPFSALCLIFSRSRINNMTAEAEKHIRVEVIKFLLDIPDALAFKNAEDEIILLFRDSTLVWDRFKMLKNRFEFGWGKELNVFINPNWIVMPDTHILNHTDDIIYLFRYARQNIKEFDDKNTIIINKTIVESMYEERRIEALMLDAIKNDRIEVFYQPIYSTKEQSFSSAEALIRIRNEKGDIIPPGVFIGIAERNGIILNLGEIVFEKVCAFLQTGLPAKLGIHYIEVNLSVVQCAYEHLAESYIRIMEKYRINPAWINLEITESASVNEKKTLLKNMKILMDYGVSFSLDDFGTGQSNLNYIVEMPVNIVKFDRNMTSAYFENGKAKYVMDAAMHMIHGMELQIVSEGIETKEQFETMKELGINYIQGYYFSKPLETSEFLEFLGKEN